MGRNVIIAGAGVYCPKGNFQKSYHIKDKSVFTEDLSTYTSGFTEFTGLNTECNRVIRRFLSNRIKCFFLGCKVLQ